MKNPTDLLLERLEHSVIAGKMSRRTFLVRALAAGLLGAMPLRLLADELETIRKAQADKLAQLEKSYDYIVIGSGSAGCALVGNLAEKTDGNILLIEAGDWDTAPTVDNPGAWFANLGTERDWGDVAIASAGVNNRAIPEHTGRVVGGGSSINATIWSRPIKADMDHWASVTGDDAWNYTNSLKLFKQMENWQGKPNPEFRGTSGPVWVQPAHDVSPLVTATLKAVAEIGLPVTDDLNTEREAALELPDVSIVQIELPYASDVIGKEYPPTNPKNTWALCGGLVAPKSRGTVKLASNKPNDRPIVDMQFLSHPDDVEYLGRAIKVARDIAHAPAPALKDFVVREVAPGKELKGEELANFIRNGATTYFHASGACRMGKDDKAVVDSQLRVQGIRNLRIADSSIMPRIVSVPTMPACALIGARMAGLLA